VNKTPHEESAADGGAAQPRRPQAIFEGARPQQQQHLGRSPQDKAVDYLEGES